MDFFASEDLKKDEIQLGTVIESADRMFEMLFTDLAQVEASASLVTLAVIAAMIAAAIAAIPAVVFPRYSLLTNGYIPDPELLFILGDTIEVRVF